MAWPEIQHLILTIIPYPFSSLSPLCPPHPLSDSLRPPILDQRLLIKASLYSLPALPAKAQVHHAASLVLSSTSLPTVSHFDLANRRFWIHHTVCVPFPHVEPGCSALLEKIRKPHLLLLLGILTLLNTLSLVSPPLCVAPHSHSLMGMLLSPVLQVHPPAYSLYILFLDNLIYPL